MPDASAIVEWVKGTTLRPVIASLSEGEAAEFLETLTQRITAAYPATPSGVVFPFKRLFLMGRRQGD